MLACSSLLEGSAQAWPTGAPTEGGDACAVLARSATSFLRFGSPEVCLPHHGRWSGVRGAESADNVGLVEVGQSLPTHGAGCLHGWQPEKRKLCQSKQEQDATRRIDYALADLNQCRRCPLTPLLLASAADTHLSA